MPKRRTTTTRSNTKIVIAIAVGIVGGVIGINAVLLAQVTGTERYLRNLQEISDQSQVITQNYEDSIAKWNEGLIDDEEILQITDENLGQLEALLSRLKLLDPPEQFREGHDMSVLSLEYELQSNRHMRNYIETGDEQEYERSSELLQLAFNYESKAFEAFAKSRNT